MNDIYLMTEFMGAIIILILLYANIFELKQQTKKRNIFTHLLIFNGILIFADLVTWMQWDWKKAPFLFWVLISSTYIVSLFMLGTFSHYLYEHISEKVKTNKAPFKILYNASILVGIVVLIFCIMGKIFTIQDGTFYPGPLADVYYMYYIISLIALSGIIISHRKELGTHDVIAALSFCVVPLCTMILALSSFNINLTIPFSPVYVLLIFIMLQSERENTLLRQSNNDEMTGLLNRRAYEDDRMNYPSLPPEPDFVYASIDINGLKHVNDTLGHAAGDELICGAASCLKQTFGNYGRVYRTGGDEFISIFFADEEKLKFLLQDLENLVDHWSGQFVDSLSLSVACASKREFPTETVDELSKIADKRMYEAKERYYSNKGVDRRKKATAQSALCNLYTKILKVNLTEDSYSIVNMDESEQISTKGFADSISSWLYEFGMSGQVHEEDLSMYLEKTNVEYLKQFFKEGRSSMTVVYRRKYEDGFRHVAMEMIPADDYTHEHQTIFLYVKDFKF